jgi:DUF4097 and DUF4098 domain-containing protein YvlB
MTEESMMILGLLRDGKISAPEAERLLRAVRETGQAAPTPPPTPAPSGGTLGQAAASAAQLAGRAWKFLPKPTLDTSRVTERVGEAAGDALRAAQSAAKDVAAEVGKIAQQTRQARPFDGASVLGPDTGRPANDAGVAEATDAAQTEVTWSGNGAERLVLVNAYGDVRVTGRDDLHGAARATVTKTAWAETDGAARTLLQQVFLVSRVENGACRVEVLAPNDALGRLTVDYEILVPHDISLEVQTTFGGVEAAGVSPALVARSRSGRLTVRRPWPEGTGEARLTTQSGDVLLDGWNAPGGSLRVETQSGDVEAQGVHCGRDLTLNSRSGDIAVTDGSAGTRARVETGSGAVRLTRLRAEALDVETGSGTVALRETSGALTVKTTSGAVDGGGLNTPAVALNTGSGDARLSFAAPFSGSVAGTTVSGDLTLALWDNSDARVDLHTTSGALTSTLPLTDREGDGVRRLAGKLGDALGTIKLQSVSGDLRLEKDAPPKRRAKAKPSE